MKAAVAAKVPAQADQEALTHPEELAPAVELDRLAATLPDPEAVDTVDSKGLAQDPEATDPWSTPSPPQSAAPAMWEPLDQSDPKESPELTERTETTEKTVTQAKMPYSTQPSTPSHALCAHLDQQAHKDQSDQRDRQAPRDRPESHPATEFPENKECKDSQDLWDDQDAKDLVEPQDSQDDSSQCPDLKDQLAHLDLQESKEPKVSPDPTDKPSKDHRDCPEMLANPDERDTPDHRAHPDLQDRTERRDLANTAQSPVLPQAIKRLPVGSLINPCLEWSYFLFFAFLLPNFSQNQPKVSYCNVLLSLLKNLITSVYCSFFLAKHRRLNSLQF